jgi:hypothetical protein
MSGEGPRGPLETGALEISEDVAAVIILEKPEMVGDLGVGLLASVRGRNGVPPWLVIKALEQLAGDLRRAYGDDARCACGEVHG